MKWLLGAYTSRYNRRHGESGHLFSGRERMEWRRGEGAEQAFKPLERGWCLGDEEFRRELLEQVRTRPGPSHFGEAVQEAVEVRAERLVVEALKRLGWTEPVLRAKRKGHPSKVALARELRSQTTMPLAWIAERLWMGRRGYLAWLLSRRDEGAAGSPADQPMLHL